MPSEWPQPGSVGPSAPSHVRVGTRGQACHLQPACRVVAQYPGEWSSCGPARLD